MKKSAFIVAVSCLLLSPFLSCSPEPVEEQPKTEEPDVHEWENTDINGDAVMNNVMSFSVGNNNLTVEYGETIRGVTAYDGTYTFEAGDLVAVAVTRSGEPEVIKLYRIASDGTSLEYAGSDNEPFAWKSKSETVSVRAWSYGTSTQTVNTLTAPENYDYTLETNQQANGYRELLYCKATNRNYSTNTALNFYHQLSRVVFNVKHERTGTLSVTSASVGSSSFPISARFNVPTGSSNVGSWTIKTTKGSITPKTETTQSGFQKTYSVVVFPNTYAKDTKLFTVPNDEGAYVYNVSASTGIQLKSGNQYSYTINVLDDYHRNPLWYVAPYNMTSATTMATTDDAGYFFSISTARTYFAAQTDPYSVYKTAGKTITGQSGTWHLPTQAEYWCIFPSPATTHIFAYDNGSGTYMASNLTVQFGYNATTKAGIPEASYWKKTSGKEIHAIRFLGTPYCSAWKYVAVGKILFVYATLIEQVANSEAAASAWYNSKFSSTVFGNRGTAVMRAFYARGTNFGSPADGSTGTVDVGTTGRYWSTSVNASNQTWYLYFYVEGSDAQCHIGGPSGSGGKSVRLFRDN